MKHCALLQQAAMSNSKQQTNPKLQQGSSSHKSKLPSTTRSAVQFPKGNEPGSPIDVSSDVDSPEQTEAYTFSDKALKKWEVQVFIIFQ